jgi:hypothetical protein
VEYTSSQYDVLNDRFITPPDGASDDFMHEHGQDDGDFDQMEDDGFCIEFDPTRTEAAFLTGVQVCTEIGQISLNSELMIDTHRGLGGGYVHVHVCGQQLRLFARVD